MAHSSKSQKKKPYLEIVFFGAISIAAYITLFTHAEWVTANYTMGGWHTVMPVGTAVFFSFIHGAFASNVLSALGLEARKH